MTMKIRSRADAGFTLIELLVAIAVFTILMIGLLNLLDSSTRMSKTEAALADTQENVRYATYHLMRTARMVGGSTMPFVRSAGGNAWVSGEVHDNVATNFSIFGRTLDNMPGSDILVLRGFFDVEPFFISQSDVNPTGMTVTIRETTDIGLPTERVINDLSLYATIANVFANRGLVISTNQPRPDYVVGMVTSSTGVTGSAPDRQIVLTYGADAGWNGLNPDGTAVSGGDPNFLHPSRAGILEAYAYYVDQNLVMRRMARRTALTTGPEPVAVNIGNLQVELGVDTDGDTFLNPATEWDSSPTLGEALAGNGPLAMRITVLGRTPFEIPDWTEPTTTFAGAGNMAVPVSGASGPRHAKWRRMEVAVALRNFM